MNRKQRIIISITGIVLVSFILIGLTYGYYLTKIKGNNNNKSISVVTANILLEYADINDELITDTKVEPGKNWTKTFVATNKGNKTVTYGVALENIVNQFERKDDIVYTLDCKQYSKTGFSIDKTNKTVTGTISGTCNGVSEETTFPSIGTILVENNIADDKAQVYTLVVTYKNVNENQNVDMNKTFSAKANIVDPNTFGAFGSNTLASVIYKSAETGGDNRTTLGTTKTEFTAVSGANDRLLNNAPDDYGTSYYYYGAVTDNYVTFANKTWRIVRINGDGSVRLVLDDVAKDASGTEIKTAFNSSYNDNAYVGYMYGTPSSTTYDDTHKNINDSIIKQKVDKWYEDNLKTNYANYLSDTLFCNDKTLASNGIGGVTTQLGYGTNETYNETYYASTERLYYSTGTTIITTAKPTFKCAESATNDYSRFTVDVATLANGNKTNGNLKYPIGLLSADEVSYAGAYKLVQTNKSYYLYNSSISSYWWLSSPLRYNGSNAIEWGVNGSSGYISNDFVNDTHVFRPSINLKAELLVGGGDGTSSNPYTVKLS